MLSSSHTHTLQLLKPDRVRPWAQGKEGGRRPPALSGLGGACQLQPEGVGVGAGAFVSVSRSFWKESQGAPRSLPFHMGTEYKNAVCRDGRAGGQGHWVHLPQRHHGSWVLSLPLQALHSQSWPQRIRPKSCFSPQKGESVVCAHPG